ncbi:MAG: ABC transporter permease [Solirubrobacterales bacterium]|nr:ABC transporter permease [Solirubrobacterales bacterium]
MRILKSEWLKMVSVPTTWLLLGTMLLVEGLAAGLLTGLSDIDDLKLRNPATLLIGTPLPTVFIFTLGALLATNEYRHGTANQTFVITPRRERVIAAKLAIGLVAGIVAALLYIAVNAGLGLSILSNRGVPVDGDLAVNVYAGVGVGIVLGCLFGVALGALLRNQILTIVTGLVLFLVRGVVALFIGTDVGKYFPGEALLSLQGTPGADAELLSQVDAGLVLGATCLALAIAGVVVTRYREIN